VTVNSLEELGKADAKSHSSSPPAAAAFEEGAGVAFCECGGGVAMDCWNWYGEGCRGAGEDRAAKGSAAWFLLNDANGSVCVAGCS
jgi:hypothetical protein